LRSIVKTKPTFLVILLYLLATAGVVTPAYARFVLPPPCKNAFTPDREIVEGKKAAADIYKTMPMLPDSSPVTQYIQQLGAKLMQYAPGYQWPYSFHVVNEADINAFALPGGPVFVNLGTIQAAETEAQLAGVMAHEISHVVMRHATCNLTKQQGQAQWWALGQLAANIFIPGAGGELAAEGVGAAAGMTFLKMGRDAEKQAESTMLDENNEAVLHADVLKVGHHGSKNSTMPVFLAAVRPRVAVISAGEDNTYGHPNPELLERLSEAGVRTLRTDRNGAVHILTDGKQLEISCFVACLEKTAGMDSAQAQPPNQQQHREQ